MHTGSDGVEYFHHIDYLIHQPGTTVEEVLSDDYFSDELAAKNPNLLEFLARSDHVFELVELVRRGPTPNASMESQFLIAHLASDALTSENCWSLQDALLQNEAALDSLYSILREGDDLLPLTASFLQRILTYLCNWFSSELLTFLQGKPDFVDCVVARMDLAAVPEILFRLLLAGTYKNYFAVCLWLDENHLVEKLLDAFFDGPDEMQPYACQFLCGLLYECRQWRLMRQLDEDGDKPSALLQRLESDATINRVITSSMLDKESLISSKPLIPLAITFLRQILLPSNRAESSLLTGLPNAEPEPLITPSSTEALVRICPCMASFKRLLLPEVVEGGSSQPALGAVRIHVIRFLCFLLADTCPAIAEEFARLDLIGVIIALFFNYKWHSLLHASVEFLVKLILDRVITVSPFQQKEPDDVSKVEENGFLPPPCNSISNGTDCLPNDINGLPPCNTKEEVRVNGDLKPEKSHSSSISEPFVTILNQLLVKHNFLQRTMTVWSENENSKGKPGFRRAGYIGHLRTIANSLVAFLLPSSSSFSLETAANDNSRTDMRPDSLITPPTTPLPSWLEPLKNQLRDSLINGFPKELWIHWCDFVSGDLARANTANFINYANFPNSNSSSSTSSSNEEDDDLDLLHPFADSDDAIASALQHAFHQYTSQSLSISFPDFFGYPEDEFDDNRERLDTVVEHALSGLNFNLDIQEDTVNNALFEQACNELVSADGEEIGDESLGLPVVCVESSASSSMASSMIAATAADRSITPIPITMQVSLDESTIVENEHGKGTEEKIFSLKRLREVFDEVLLHDDETLDDLGYGLEQDSFGHAREPSKRGDEIVPDFSLTKGSSSTCLLNSFSSPRLLHNSTKAVAADRTSSKATTVNSSSSPPLPYSTELRPKLALAPGPTLSNGAPVMSAGRGGRFPASVPPVGFATSPEGQNNITSKSAPFDQLSSRMIWGENDEYTDFSKLHNSPDQVNFLMLPRIASDLVFQAPPTSQPSEVDLQSQNLQATASFKPTPKQSSFFPPMLVRYDESTAPPSTCLSSSSLPRPILPTMRSHRLARAPLYENGKTPPSSTNGDSSSPPSPEEVGEDDEVDVLRRRRRPGNLSADDTHSLDRGTASSLKGAWFFERVRQEQEKDVLLHRSVSDGFLRNSFINLNNHASPKKEFQPFVINDLDPDDDDFILGDQSTRTNRFRTHTTLNLKSNPIDFEAI